MSLLFSELKSKENLFSENLKSCSHIVELDFIRTDFDMCLSKWSEFNNSKDKIHVLGYSIREFKSTEHSYKLHTYPNLLFVDYPDYNENTSTNIQYEMSDEYYKVINTFFDIYIIPDILKHESIIEISNNQKINEIIDTIETNIDYIQKSHIDNLNRFAVYIQLYIDLLYEITSCKFSSREHEKIQTDLKNINFLKVAVELDIQNRENHIDKNKYLELANKNKFYISILNRIEYLEITFKNSEVMPNDIAWIKNLEIKSCNMYNFHIENKGTFVRIYNLKDNSLLLCLYSNLIQYSHIDVQLIMSKDEFTEDSNDIVPHTIEISSTPWAYVFNRLYGDDVNYTKEKDQNVIEVLEHIKKTGITPEYIFS
tara:strand:+ start:6873 stop:7979 length:1107 start_codon:yes stop_codon:yes gene_type:complete